MNREQFFRKAEDLFGPTDVLRIKDAYIFAKEFHRGQKPRDNGERYFNHPRRVALYLMGFAPVTADEVILGLLHDVVEDRYVPERLMRKSFGATVARGTLLLSKYAVSDGPHGETTKIKKDTGTYYQQIAKGPYKVRRAKCADRLDNISDMSTWTPERKKKYILETRVFITPMAYRTDPRLAKLIEDACNQAEAGLYLNQGA